MPSAFQRGEIWYVRYLDESGRRCRQRTTASGRREAEALAHELEADSERRRHGLVPKRNGGNMTLAELCTWWLENRCPVASRSVAESQFKTRVLSEPIGALPLQQITTARLEAHFRHLEKVRGPHAVTINHLRANLRAAFNKARKAGLWTGANPAADTEPRKVPKRAYETISAEEVPLVLANVPAHWRGFTAAAIYQGLRKGECAGLRKSDVDLPRDLLTIRVSYDNDTTKGKHADVVPLAPPMRPYIEAAMTSPGAVLFPDLDGAMRTPESDPQEVLRAALARAGVVYGYDHTCRRAKCRASGAPHVERHPDPAPRKCPRAGCGMKLWPIPLPRKVRFHDLRHSCGTILLRAGVDPHRVQRILRHASITTTTGTYSHLLAEDLRDAFDAFTPPDVTPPATETAPAMAVSGAQDLAGPMATPPAPDLGPVGLLSPGDANFGAQLGPKLSDPANAKGATLRKPSGSRALLWSGRQDSNLRPLGPEPSALPG